jgi:hypothetical protein
MAPKTRLTRTVSVGLSRAERVRDLKEAKAIVLRLRRRLSHPNSQVQGDEFPWARPTHGYESPFLRPIDSTRVMRDFRRSGIARFYANYPKRMS